MSSSSSSSGNPFDAFPPQVRADIDGLTWLGYLEDRVSFAGHTFAMRTLRGDEEMLAALSAKPYADTSAFGRAHVWAIVSLAVTHIDGHSDFCPQINPDKADYAQARFQWFSEHWFYPLAVYLHNHYAKLLERQQAAMDALEDFSYGSQPMPTPTADSSTVKASSEPEQDIRDFLDPQPS